MANRYWRKKALISKIETTYGTDPTPTGATDAILAHDINLRPLQSQKVERPHDTPFFGSRPAILTNVHVALSFGVEIAGAGTAGDAPAYGPLLRACGLAETLTATTDAQYDPVSTGIESVGNYLNIDGVQQKILGYRANLQMSFRPSALSTFTFDGLGLFTTPTDTAAPIVDVSGFQVPVPVSDANTDFTVNGVAVPMEELTFDFGNQVNAIFRVGEEKVSIVDRKVSGSMLVKADTLAIFDPFTIARNRTQVPIQVVHGITAGNIVQVDADLCELDEPQYQESNGEVMYRIPFMAVPSDAGDDEIKITVK
ncbi:hypothetical protein SAMN06265365_14845 [Tistlia consotensis]|uniref:Uncharacterized protein n=1 Tax=Tistlia consotensis USBA 355 TaxID=560819 RepID=A0A1Y6CR64_9PROT|nr:phage tail tube protein [Tistlia consotensis]SMF83073.1 hypothetical protein SAMN05428998_14846 [Tistlia consotensis USBA 355]SNS31974.1 hypothetical protein SAMN06265365_14845 [Tistlia consotensis]